MGTTTRFRIDEPDKMLATMTMNMTVGDWRKVRAALDKGMDGYYGPEQRMVRSIDEVLTKVDQTFYSHIGEGE